MDDLDSDSDEGFDTVDASKPRTDTIPKQFDNTLQGRTNTKTNVGKDTLSPGARAISSKSTQSRDSTYTYNMDHKYRGFAVIIDNTTFGVPGSHLEDRKGTDPDVTLMEKTLSGLGFAVYKKRNMTGDNMVHLMLKAANHHAQTDADSFICVLMTHGDGDVIFAVDRAVSMEELAGCFKGELCEGLVGKPKIFIINACRGEDVDVGVTVADGSEVCIPEKPEADKSIPVEADFLYIYSTPPGHYSFRNEKRGSKFIQVLCKWLSQMNIGDLEISHVLRRVTYDMAVNFESRSTTIDLNKKKQCPCYTSMLTKELYFS